MGEWANTVKVEKFLLAEDRDGDARLVIFATNENLMKLMLCSPERSRSAVDGRAEGCSVRERSVALAWTRTLLECTST